MVMIDAYFTAPPCQTGSTMWCDVGRHDNCGHRVGGAQEAGVWQPECYITFPDPNNRNRQVVMPAAWPGQSYAMVVSPSHRVRCACECHQVGQMPLFGGAA